MQLRKYGRGEKLEDRSLSNMEKKVKSLFL